MWGSILFFLIVFFAIHFRGEKKAVLLLLYGSLSGRAFDFKQGNAAFSYFLSLRVCLWELKEKLDQAYSLYSSQYAVGVDLLYPDWW